MARYDEELLETARRLLAREPGQRGRLSRARVRRSISTSYYAIFHFLLEEAARTVVGVRNDLAKRRRILSRQFTHDGVRLTLDRVRGARPPKSVEDFLRHPSGASETPMAIPNFVRLIASAFIDAHSKRNDADYNLNEALSEEDALLLADRVERAIESWRQANEPSDRDLKKALCTLMLLGGKLRKED